VDLLRGFIEDRESGWRGSKEGKPLTERRGQMASCALLVDWWYHNRGHSECQLMRRLAARCPCSGSTASGCARQLRDAPNSRATLCPQVDQYLKAFAEIPAACGCTALSSSALHTTVLRWNGRLLFEQVRLLQRWIGIQRPASGRRCDGGVGGGARPLDSARLQSSDVFSEFPKSMPS